MTCPVPLALAPYADRLRIGTGPSPRGAIEAAMATFAALPGPIRAASASEWSMYYFGSLIIPTMIHAVCHNRLVEVAIDGMGCETDADGRVCGFYTGDEKTVTVEKLFDTLAGDHLAIMIGTCQRLAGLSSRVLWSNAAVVLDFAVGELRHDGIDEAAFQAADDLLTGRRPSPLATPFREGAQRERKICCLRYRLPRTGVCAGICPRGRNPARSTHRELAEIR